MDETPEEFPRLDLSIRQSVLAVLAETDTAIVRERLEDTQRLLDALAEETPTQHEQQKDAERFRWLCAHALVDTLRMDDTGYWRIPTFLFSCRARSFEEAVDLAMKEDEK